MNFDLTGHNQREIHIEPLINYSQTELRKICRSPLVEKEVQSVRRPKSVSERKPSRARKIILPWPKWQQSAIGTLKHNANTQ